MAIKLSDHDRDYYITMLVVFTSWHEDAFHKLSDAELVKEHDRRLAEKSAWE